MFKYITSFVPLISCGLLNAFWLAHVPNVPGYDHFGERYYENLLLDHVSDQLHLKGKLSAGLREPDEMDDELQDNSGPAHNNLNSGSGVTFQATIFTEPRFHRLNRKPKMEVTEPRDMDRIKPVDSVSLDNEVVTVKVGTLEKALMNPAMLSLLRGVKRLREKANALPLHFLEDISEGLAETDLVEKKGLFDPQKIKGQNIQPNFPTNPATALTMVLPSNILRTTISAYTTLNPSQEPTLDDRYKTFTTLLNKFEIRRILYALDAASKNGEVEDEDSGDGAHPHASALMMGELDGGHMINMPTNIGEEKVVQIKEIQSTTSSKLTTSTTPIQTPRNFVVYRGNSPYKHVFFPYLYGQWKSAQRLRLRNKRSYGKKSFRNFGRRNQY